MLELTPDVPRKTPERRKPTELFDEWAESREGDAFLVRQCQEYGEPFLQRELQRAWGWLKEKQDSPYAEDRKAARKVNWQRFFENWLRRSR